ncbi:MAG: peptide-methionine (S)-S-oxide reductase MsrA [Euryarchaeota archaeon]|nr:peptide-methionine (S)-S-oxide reductase MsrA [Euryarchaeota archaeon]
MEKATFGAGCFWGVEAAFQNIDGVVLTTVGYMGGDFKDPTYEDVCTDKTAHAEVVHIIFNPLIISYEKLLDVFWDVHDPTQKNRQGPDRGTQYRSVIFYYYDQQKKLAEQSKKKLEESKKYKKPIVTEITLAKEFYPAEEYHQKYIEKHGGVSCHI